MKKSLFLLVAALLVMQSCSRDYIPLDEKIAECYLTKVPITDDEYSVSMDDIEEYIATFYSGYKVNSITEKYLIDDIMVYVVEFDYGGWKSV